MTRRPWTCSNCGTLNQPTRSRKCAGCGKISRPKRRIPAHERVLHDMPYGEWEQLSQAIHGGELGACGCCGEPKPEDGRHFRDHDHRTGNPRGLACFRCNKRNLDDRTVVEVRSALGYLERAGEWFGASQTEGR